MANLREPEQWAMHHVQGGLSEHMDQGRKMKKNKPVPRRRSYDAQAPMTLAQLRCPRSICQKKKRTCNRLGQTRSPQPGFHISGSIHLNNMRYTHALHRSLRGASPLHSILLHHLVRENPGTVRQINETHDSMTPEAARGDHHGALQE